MKKVIINLVLLALIALGGFVVSAEDAPTPSPEPPRPKYSEIITEFEAGTIENYDPVNKIAVGSEDEFYAAIKNAGPGTGIYFKDGVYTDVEIRVELNGEKDKPIVITALDPGKAVFTRNSRFVIKGEYIEISGFYFKEVLYDTVKYPAFSGANIFTLYGTKHCRITDNYFYKCGLLGNNKEGEDTTPYKKIISIEQNAQYNRIDRNTFEDPYCMQIGIYVNNQNNTENSFNKIDHNYFVNVKHVNDLHPGMNENGMESIQIGQGGENTPRFCRTNTIVEYNLFENVTGDNAEIISNKADNNIYRYNSFVNCPSGFTVRGGNGCIVEGNYLYNVEKGLRLYGHNHYVVNNYFEDCPRSSIDVGMGSTTHGYVKDLVLAFNTIVNTKSIGFSLDDGIYPPPASTKAPDGVQLINNLIVTKTGTAFRYSKVSNAKCLGNFADLTGAAQLNTNTTNPEIAKALKEGVKLMKSGLSTPGKTFELTEKSPAVNAGVPFEGVKYDMMGNLRDSKPDVGALEFGGAKKKIEPLNNKETGKQWLKRNVINMDDTVDKNNIDDKNDIVDKSNVENKDLVNDQYGAEDKYNLDDQINKSVVLMIGKNKGLIKGELVPVDKDNIKVYPVVIGERALVPVRFISEAFDAGIDWDSMLNILTITSTDSKIQITLGEDSITVNGVKRKMDTSAQIIEGRTMIPLRAMAEALGKKLLWDPRGLIVISDESTTFNTGSDKAILDKLIDKIK